MKEQELMNFVEWLPENVDLFKGLSVEETVSKINDLSTSDDGKQILEQLTKQYKGMELFKKGGKLHQLLCFKSGGKGPDCGCNKKVIKAQPGAEMVAPGFDKRLELRHNQMMANGELKDGGELPRYAKIIETRSPYSAERTLYYSDIDGDYDVKDGRLISIEEGVPVAIGHNILVRNAKQFGLNLPEVNEFKEPWYGQYRNLPDGMDLSSAWWIDKDKAIKETYDKINKIRKKK